jgi:predicted membrane channel-forming protein YqfA (hemolysin III family)
MKKFLTAAAIALAPAIASAASIGSSISALLSLVSNTLGALVYIVMSLGLLVFLWGVVQYVISDSGDDKEKARKYMIWGIIGLFVMSTVWGIVGLLKDSIWGSSDIGLPPEIPSVPTISGR